jgi:hypothetical protein
MRKMPILSGVCMAFAVLRPVYGQTPPPPPIPIETTQTVLATPDIELAIGGRAWYVFASGGQPKQPLSFSNPVIINFPQFSFLTAGPVLSARFAALPNTTFIVSELVGSLNSSANILAPLPGFRDGVVLTNTENQLTRFDTEILAQTSIPDTNWGWILGVRWEHLSGSGKTLQAFFPTTTPNNSFSFAVPTSDFVTLKSGLALALPLDAQGSWRLYGNVMLLAGAYTQTDVLIGTVGPDISVGLQYHAASNLSLDIRYRSVVNFFFSGPPGTQIYNTQHGPMAGLTLRF